MDIIEQAIRTLQAENNLDILEAITSGFAVKHESVTVSEAYLNTNAFVRWNKKQTDLEKTIIAREQKINALFTAKQVLKDFQLINNNK